MSASDSNVDIAILDTGVSSNHPDLNVYRDVTFSNGTTTGNDDNGMDHMWQGLQLRRTTI